MNARHSASYYGFHLGMLLTLCLVCALSQQEARADQAVIIGINQFQNLPRATLKGCVNDANLINEVLKEKHYTTHCLSDQEATHDAIVKLMKEIRRSLSPRERFVFFFAGHGAQQGYLLCHDATEEGGECLSRGELKSLVAAIPARSRTVILDACFSESLIATRDVPAPGETTRSYPLKTLPYEEILATEATQDAFEDARDNALKNIAPATSDKNADKAKDDTAICYWTAAMRTEKAIERNMPDLATGEKHGVFSYYVAQELKKDAKTWGDINAQVRLQMQSKVADRQRPAMSESFLHTAVFEPKTIDEKPAPIAADPIVKPVGHAPNKPVPASQRQPALLSVWDAFNRSHVDTKVLALTIDPDKAIVSLNQDFHMRVDSNFDGYLVIIDTDEKGRLHLAFPAKTFDVNDAKLKNVKPWKARMDKPGKFQVRAIVFRSREMAARLINAFPSERFIDSQDQAATKSLQLEDDDGEEYYTFDLLFHVVEGALPLNPPANKSAK